MQPFERLFKLHHYEEPENKKFYVGDLVTFNYDYFEDSVEMLSFIGLIVPNLSYQNMLTILWNDGSLEIYPDHFSYYFEIVATKQ